MGVATGCVPKVPGQAVQKSRRMRHVFHAALSSSSLKDKGVLFSPWMRTLSYAVYFHGLFTILASGDPEGKGCLLPCQISFQFPLLPYQSLLLCNGWIWRSIGAKVCVHLSSPVHMLWLVLSRQGQGVRCLKVVFVLPRSDEKIEFC